MLTTSPTSTGAELDTGVRDFIRITGEAYVTHGQGVEKTPVTARQIAEKVRAPWTQGGPVMHRTTEHTVTTPHGDVRIRAYDPDARTAKPALIYIHGGGWVMFGLDTHDRIMREYAGRAGVCVVGVDYSLSPEAHFPVALEEILAVIDHVGSHAAELNIDSDHLFLGGDSAGGNLSLSASIALRDAGKGSVLSGLLLNYGAFDVDLSPEDVRNYGGPEFMLTADEMAYFWTQYLADPAEAANPLATPLNADLHELPPVFLCVPQCDVLTGQSLLLDSRLKAAGVPTRTVVYEGASHSFLEAISISAIAERAFADASAWLREQVGA